MAGRALVMVVGAIALSAVGCGGDGEPTATTTGAPTSAAPAPKPNGAAVGDGRGGIGLQKIGEFDSPVYVTQPSGGDPDVYVVEQGGRIERFRPAGGIEPEAFLDLTGEVTSGGEQGLLSMAFAPDYSKSGLLYVDYTDTDGNTQVVEYHAPGGGVADPASARPVIEVDQPFSNHNGGQLQFGPDGLLYIGLGDGGSEDDPQRNGQDLSTLLSKILRIEPRPDGAEAYRIPADNPFANQSDARPETYSYGLRNPWRFSFDRDTGALWIGDVGQNEFEEVDGVARGDGAGANFGWSAYEGDVRFNDDQGAPGATRPVLTYSHDQGCSVTGGYVVRDAGLRRSSAGTSMATSARASCAASPPGPGPPRATTARSECRCRR